MRTRLVSTGLLLLVILAWPSDVTLARTRRTENVVLVTLDGVRWQEIFSGLDPSLAGAAAYGAAAESVFTDFAAPSPGARRAKLMPFLWGTLVAGHGFAAGDRTAGSAASVTNRHWFSYPRCSIGPMAI
jgi:hypothetical protein